MNAFDDSVATLGTRARALMLTFRSQLAAGSTLGTPGQRIVFSGMQTTCAALLAAASGSEATALTNLQSALTRYASVLSGRAAAPAPTPASDFTDPVNDQFALSWFA